MFTVPFSATTIPFPIATSRYGEKNKDMTLSCSPILKCLGTQPINEPDSCYISSIGKMQVTTLLGIVGNVIGWQGEVREECSSVMRKPSVLIKWGYLACIRNCLVQGPLYYPAFRLPDVAWHSCDLIREVFLPESLKEQKNVSALCCKRIYRNNIQESSLDTEDRINFNI